MSRLGRHVVDGLKRRFQATPPEETAVDPEPDGHEPHEPVKPIEEPFGIPESGQQEQLRWSDYSHKARKPTKVMNDYRRL